MKINILLDNDSWIYPYIIKLREEIISRDHECILYRDSNDIKLSGDILFILGCTKIFKKINLHKNNIVIHESDLPKGKGWSPLTWQILEGKNKIPITMFEADTKVDNGDFYLKDFIDIDPLDLFTKIKEKQGLKTIEMALYFIDNYNNINKTKQIGNETFYKKRTCNDSELDISKSIDEQFNLLRVCDNENYPAFFIKNGKKFILKIFEK